MRYAYFSLRQASLVLLVALAALVSACGGGGGSSSSTTTPTTPTNPTTPTTPTTPVGTIVSPMGCGTVTSTGTGNTTPIVVDGFPCAVAGTAGDANVPQQPYISVKICKPGTNICQTIDHVILDTGSSGLRVASTALSSTLQPGATGLPLVSVGSGLALTECELYVDSYAYGPIVNVDVYIAGEFALNTTMQVFGNANFPVPNGCSSQGGTETNTVQTFGGNGLLGVSFAPFDNYTPYFNCDATTGLNCNSDSTNFPGIPNIVTLFGSTSGTASDNNGVTITLPTIAATGATSPVSGTLNFGISTQSNNTPGSSVVVLVNDGSADQTYGTFYTQVGGANGVWYPAYIDSGTDAVYFNDAQDAALVTCASSTGLTNYYCPTSTVQVPFNYANFGAGPTYTVVSSANLSVANATYLGTTNNLVAYSNIAGPSTSSSTITSEVAFGLTTFFGHTNYILFSNASAATFGTSTNLPGPVNGIQ